MSATALEELLTQSLRVGVENGLTYRQGTLLSKQDARNVVRELSHRQLEALDAQALQMLVPVWQELTPARAKDIHYAPLEKTAAILETRKLDPVAKGRLLVIYSVLWWVLQGSKTLRQKKTHWQVTRWLYSAIDVMKKRKLIFNQDQIRTLWECDRIAGDYRLYLSDIALSALSQQRETFEFEQEDMETLRKLRDQFSRHTYRADTRAHIAMLNEILDDKPAGNIFWEGEQWATQVNQSLRTFPQRQRLDWTSLLEHAGTANLSKPSADWLSKAKPLKAKLSDEEFAKRMTGWLHQFMAQPRPAIDRAEGGWRAYWEQVENYRRNSSYLVGLIWLTQLDPLEFPSNILADTVEYVARLPQSSREPSAYVAAAAIRCLANRDDTESLAQLSRLELRIRWPKLKKLVKKQLEEVIKRRDLDRTEIEETLVPTFDLKDGVAVLPFSGISAVVTLGRSDKPSLTWKLDTGKTARSLPVSLKAQNPGASAQAKQVVADIEKMRAAQRTRLDLLMRRPRTWTFDQWRHRYLDHGLVGSLARRLIWTIDDTSIVWRDGQLIDADGRVQSFTGNAVVRLWHPAQRQADEVLAWRASLEKWEITQPFKQAFREIYLLTDAELRTNSYSNRFAAHILRAPTLLSITQVRQWKCGMYGGPSSPSFDLADYGLRAEWWMQAAGQEILPYGAPLYLATDQVRFHCTSDDSARKFGHTGTEQPLPLDLIPPLALSEIMRDVDLFVAIASVGNDPNWQDGGPQGRYRDYWHSYSFGDLTESAKTRRAVLESLLPRLTKIKDRCSLSDKFLLVRGHLRTYKIHLGSGNILMEPNDQYLCIVPDARARTSPENRFLPFEGDSTLSIILSKAFLLADDQSIKDPSITRQISI